MSPLFSWTFWRFAWVCPECSVRITSYQDWTGTWKPLVGRLFWKT